MTEDEAIAQAAEKYRAEGYDVTVRPAAGDLPAELRWRRPALVARRNGTAVLLEVWSPDRLNDLPPNRMPDGWEFDIVSLPLAADGGFAAAPPPTRGYVGQLLTEIEDLLPRVASRARFLLAWSAAEAAMRVAARRAGIPDRTSNLQLVGDLTSDGFLTGEQYARVRELQSIRNRLAHGIPVKDVPPGHVEFLAGLARELVAEVSPPAPG